jgi:hypothetical protein
MPRVIFNAEYVDQPHPRQRVVYKAGNEYLVSGALAEKLVAEGKATPAKAASGGHAGKRKDAGE